jgi:hypothetical protein
MANVGQRIGAGFLTLFFGSIGDIISRSLWYNCTSDKLWSNALFMPPLSIGSAIMYWTGIISQDDSSQCSYKHLSVYDLWAVLIPVFVILLTLLISKYLKMYTDSGERRIFPHVVLFSLLTIMFAAARYYRYTKECETFYPDLQSRPHEKYIGKAFLMAGIVNLSIFFLNWISSVKFIQDIPFIGRAFYFWHLLGKKIPLLQYAIPLTLAHIVLNFEQNDASAIQKICSG